MSNQFDPNRDAVFVKGEVSGPVGHVRVKLVLDTGATTSLIHPDYLTIVGCDPAVSTDQVPVITGVGTQLLPRLVLSRLTALGLDRIDFPVLSHALPPATGADGLLGLDFFRGQVLTLDFRNGLITLS
jgi:hypothetical protein